MMLNAQKELDEVKQKIREEAFAEREERRLEQIKRQEVDHMILFVVDVVYDVVVVVVKQMRILNNVDLKFKKS